MTESPSLAPNKRKLLRRALHKVVYFLAPEQGLTKEGVPPFLAGTAIVALVHVFRDLQSIRNLGLPRTADQLGLWWEELTPHERSHWALVLERVAGATANDPALRTELFAFVQANRLLSDRLSRLLEESPVDFGKRFAALHREANERARREIPRIMARLNQILEQANGQIADLMSGGESAKESRPAE